MSTPNTNSSFIGTGIGIEATARNGYKVICIRVSDEGEYTLLSPHYSSLGAKLDDDSKCGVGAEHQDTDSFAKCTCGFYGYFTPKDAIEHRRGNTRSSINFFVAQAAYSGDVVIAEHGMRSSHQRIRKVFIDTCWNCENQGTTLVVHEAGVLVPSCETCSEGVTKVAEDFPIEIVPSDQLEFINLLDQVTRLSSEEKHKLRAELEYQISEELINSITELD